MAIALFEHIDLKRGSTIKLDWTGLSGFWLHYRGFISEILGDKMYSLWTTNNAKSCIQAICTADRT